MSEEPIRTSSLSDHSGRSVILVVYVSVVILAGFWGYLLGSIGIEDLHPVSLFFLIELQPTPLGLAIYGMGTLGGGLGVVLLAVRYASRRYTGPDNT